MIRPKEVQEIMDGLKTKNRELTMKNDEYSRLTDVAAEKKKTYLTSLSTKLVELKINGASVTLIKDIAKGDKIVADLGYKWDVAEGVTRACLERIKDLRESIGTYRSLLTWLRAELLNKE